MVRTAISQNIDCPYPRSIS